MAHVSRKLTSPLEGALAGGGDPATSPLYVFTPFLKLIVLVAVADVAEVTFGATIWLVIFTIFMVSAMYRLVMRWVTDGSGGSGLAEEEFGPWAVKVNAAITVIEYTLTFLVSMAALVTFIADRVVVLNEPMLGLGSLQYRVLVALALSVLTGWLVNRGPKVAARTFGPATAGVLALLWAMVIATLWNHLTGSASLAETSVLPDLNLRAFSLDPTEVGEPSYLHFTLGGFSRILAVMTGIEVFANLVAAYSGDDEEKASKAFGSLLIIMGTTSVTMLVVGPAILAMSNPAQANVSVFTQTMDQLLPEPLPLLGTLVGVAVLLSACAASAQGLQNLALGLTTRHYIPGALGRVNDYGVADKPVWLEVGVCCACFVAFGTSEETYLAIYAAGVFILLSMTGWAASKRLVGRMRLDYEHTTAATLIGVVVAALLTSIATVIIFHERFFEGAWTFFVFIPLLYVAFSYFRKQLGAPSPVLDRLGEIEEAALGGFGPGQREALEAIREAVAVEIGEAEWAEAPVAGDRWRAEAAPLSDLLVALDGSEHAERLLPFAARLAREGAGRIRLLSVLPEAIYDAPSGGPSTPLQGVAKERDEYLAAIARRLMEQGVRVSHEVRGGRTAQTINDAAEAGEVDAIVISSHGRAGLTGFLLGQTAHDLVQLASRPVVVVRLGAKGQVDASLDQVVVALDGSSFAERVLPYARWLAKNLGSELILVSVLEVPEAVEFGALADAVEALRAEVEETARDYLERVKSALTEEGIAASGIVVATGPARAIIDQTDKHGAAMSMLTTHGRSGLSGALMGSVAWRVVRHSSSPVFLYPVREARRTGRKS